MPKDCTVSRPGRVPPDLDTVDWKETLLVDKTVPLVVLLVFWGDQERIF
jgi:hypothetical protein